LAQSTDPYVWGTGRRKTAVARVRVKSGGSGNFIINGKKFDEYFTTDDTRRAALSPLVATEMTTSYDVWVNVSGGGMGGQSDAVKLGIARALKKESSDFEASLRTENLLTRDARKVERKKYGLRKARRATQFSKR